MIIAERTLALIDNVITQDQGADFRMQQGFYMPLMDDAYRGREDKFRSHFGVSQLGKPCSRELWYGFRWFTYTPHSAKTLRLFNRGHLEEARFLAMLSILPGVTLYATDSTGGQYRLSDFGNHFGSALDGVAVGIPDIPGGVPCLLEFKTAGDKSFAKTVKEGMEKANPVHFVQVQTCMSYFDLTHCLYMVVNKNTEDLHAEVIPFDDHTADYARRRAEHIIFTDVAPRRLANAGPGWHECRFCDHKDVCLFKGEPERNCRSCTHSCPETTGGWLCDKFNIELSKEAQLLGCNDWVPNTT